MADSSLKNDIKKLQWFKTGISEEQAKNAFLDVPGDLSVYAERAIENLEKYINKWTNYFIEYERVLIEYLNPDPITEIRKQWKDGLDNFINANKGIIPAEKSNKVLREVALFRATTVARWFYSVHCAIYKQLERLLNASSSIIATQYNDLCNIAQESANIKNLFPIIGPIDQNPPAVDITADVQKIAIAWDIPTTTSKRDMFNLPATQKIISADKIDKLVRKKTTVESPMRKWAIIGAVIAAIIVIIIIIVVSVVVTKKERFTYPVSIPPIARRRARIYRQI